VKAYLITTGTIFALVTLAHIARAVDERGMWQTHPVEFYSMAGLGVLSAILAVWAWRLLRRLPQS
jgi:hypothetical protein